MKARCYELFNALVAEANLPDLAVEVLRAYNMRCRIDAGALDTTTQGTTARSDGQ